jgi:allantoin racemase
LSVKTVIPSASVFSTGLGLRILLVVPITGINDAEIGLRLSFLRSIAGPGTELGYVQVRGGPPAIECAVDHVRAAAEVLRCVEEEAGLWDAVIVWCAGDPGVEAARTLVDVPVIGPGEAMRALASTLGKRVCGVPAPLPVLELRKDLGKTFELTKAKVEALARDGYDSFYLDCLGLFGMGRPMREATGLPVIDPAEASLKMAEVSVELGLRPSRVAYPRYPPPHRRG